MKKLMNAVRSLRRDESGQDLLEYALLTGLIALAAVVAIQAVGGGITGVFTAIGAAVAAIPL